MENIIAYFMPPQILKKNNITDFNSSVFEKINTTPSTGVCDLSGTIFPGDIVFKQEHLPGQLPVLQFENCTFHEQTSFSSLTLTNNLLLSRCNFKKHLGISYSNIAKRLSLFDTELNSTCFIHNVSS